MGSTRLRPPGLTYLSLQLERRYSRTVFKLDRLYARVNGTRVMTGGVTVQLRRVNVVDGALAMLDADGLDGLTMRKLATHLGVQAGGLYWHYPNKSALLDAMAEKLVEGVGAPLPDGPWDTQVATLAARLREALLSRRDGARVVGGTYVSGPNTVLAGRTFITVLSAAGMARERAVLTSSVVARYVIGHTIEEQAQTVLNGDANWRDGLVGAMRSEDPDDAGTLRTLLGADQGELFAYGVSLIVDGIRYQLAAGDQGPQLARAKRTVSRRAGRGPAPATSAPSTVDDPRERTLSVNAPSTTSTTTTGSRRKAASKSAAT